ncbi:substrate-binding domain-containing protein, partial [Nostoc sp. 'Peltigera malacea cyanobiont' DB3992]|uniref:substrate-binding domain-containing protein n=1 Tax=Nostoc sp. 'Peltigera malacea cyanobiont' DB3992 TaxID=1206980 RepID=UPI000C061611
QMLTQVSTLFIHLVLLVPCYKQIQAGAPADIFISAANDQINVLQNSTPSKLVAGSRKNVVKNSLVLIVPTTFPISAGSAGLTSFNGLTNANITGIAIGDYRGTPPVVPAGIMPNKF